eukprot:9325686-Pyramimonas_sp.AAC.1
MNFDFPSETKGKPEAGTRSPSPTKRVPSSGPRLYAGEGKAVEDEEEKEDDGEEEPLPLQLLVVVVVVESGHVTSLATRHTQTTDANGGLRPRRHLG